MASAENVSQLELAAVAAVHRVGAYARRTSPRRSARCRRPTSSSGVKPMRIVPCGISGCCHQVLGGGHDLGHAGLVVGAEQRRARGGDDVVADLLARAPGFSARRSTAVGSSGSTMSCPCQLRWTIGFTPAPLISGDVSTWAMKPMTGTFGFLRGGRDGRHDVAVLVARRRRRGRSRAARRPGGRAARAAWRAGIGARGLGGLGVVGDVAQEALDDAGLEVVVRAWACSVG